MNCQICGDQLNGYSIVINWNEEWQPEELEYLCVACDEWSDAIALGRDDDPLFWMDRRA